MLIIHNMITNKSMKLLYQVHIYMPIIIQNQDYILKIWFFYLNVLYMILFKFNINRLSTKSVLYILLYLLNK